MVREASSQQVMNRKVSVQRSLKCLTASRTADSGNSINWLLAISLGNELMTTNDRTLFSRPPVIDHSNHQGNIRFQRLVITGQLVASVLLALSLHRSLISDCSFTPARTTSKAHASRTVAACLQGSKDTHAVRSNLD